MLLNTVSHIIHTKNHFYLLHFKLFKPNYHTCSAKDLVRCSQVSKRFQRIYYTEPFLSEINLQRNNGLKRCIERLKEEPMAYDW